MRSAPLRSLLLCSLLTPACSDDGLAPAQSTDDDASATTTSPGIETSGGDATVGADATGGGTTSGSPPAPTGTSSGETTSGRSPTDDSGSDSGPGSATTTDGGSGSESGSGSSSEDGSSSSSSDDGGESSSSDGGMMSACPDIAGTSLIGGPADLYGFCWYLTAPMDTCDSACAELVGGANLAAMAESSYPDNCSGAAANDVSTWLFDNGNPGGWLNVGGATSAHTLGYGYSMVGSFYGKCSTGPVSVGTYPGETPGGGLESERQLICACALGSP